MNIHSAYGEKPIKTPYKPGKTRTKQAMQKECDINFIVEKYQTKGSLEHLRKYEGQYADFTDIDYHSAMNVITEAGQMFEELPANVRAEFNNSPEDFLNYATDENNHEGMVELGLAYPTPHEDHDALKTPETTPELKTEPVTT